MRPRLAVAALALSWGLACGGLGTFPMDSEGGAPLVPPTKPPPSPGDVTIQVLPDGRFEPDAVTIRAGATVTWSLSDPYRQSVAPLRGEGTGCADIAPYEEPYVDLTGPMPRNPSGLFVLNQDGPGLSRRGDGFVTDGPLGAVHEDSWDRDDNTGAFVRLRWSWLQPDRRGAYDWSVLDRAMNDAIAHGKLFSVGVKAGFHGTPDWIFDEGVQRLVFRDFGTHPGVDDCKCGAFMALGSPTDVRYQELYFEMLDALAAHIRTNAAWYRHLAYIKPSGANLFSAEARLPKRCTCAATCTDDSCPVPREWKDAPGLDPSGRICNTKVWAEAGYTTEGLYTFYDRQLDRLAAAFPDKDFAFLLIHDGFPLVGPRDYLRCGEEKKGQRGLPEPVEQTREILVRGWRNHGPRFTPMHAALRADKPVNRLLQRAQQPAQFIGLQTTNDAHDTEALAEHVAHGIEAGATFIELYEEGTLRGDGKGLADLNHRLHTTRRAASSGDGPRREPFPPHHPTRFEREGRVAFVNPATCGEAEPAIAVVYVDP